MKVCEERLISRLKKVGCIGETEDGICREAFTPAYFKGVETLKSLMEEEKLEVRVDAVGNVYGRKAGTKPDASIILVGSHLDTVRNGGLFDGALGIAAALECLSIMRENEVQSENSIEIVAFNGEEGGALGGTFGSRVAAGGQSLALDGIDEKLAMYNLNKEAVTAAKLDYIPKVYLEMHIEQGMQLHNEQLEIGIVEGIVGITRYRICIKGKANHAGTTPMAFRKDALVAASRLIVIIDSLAKNENNPFVATVGRIEVVPNSVNVVPGQVEMILELREMDEAVISNFIETIRREAKGMDGYEISFDLYSQKSSVILNKELILKTEELCRKMHIKYKKMYSGAGHDAMELAKISPAALVFIPSKDGISHSKEEFSLEEDIVRGTGLLLELLLQLGTN